MLRAVNVDDLGATPAEHGRDAETLPSKSPQNSSRSSPSNRGTCSSKELMSRARIFLKELNA